MKSNLIKFGATALAVVVGIWAYNKYIAKKESSAQ